MVKLLFLLFLSGLMIAYTMAAKLDVAAMEKEEIVDQEREDIKRNFHVFVIVSNIFGLWGNWGNSQFCPHGSFASGFKIKAERPDGDDTAMNGIKLYCSKPNGVSVGAHITSTVEPWGDWTDVRSCSRGHFLNGFALRVESPEGKGDDTAANDIRTTCEWSSRRLYGGGTHWGRWGEYNRCRAGNAICGVQTKVEKWQRKGDDTASNNVKFYCCKKK